MSPIPIPDEERRLTPSEVFDDWLSVREHASYDRLSREAAQPYRYMWKRWCDWLGEVRESTDPFLYLSATSQDVFAFLRNGPDPASKRKSRSTPTSPITRQRYGRLMRDVYAHAVAFGYVESSPVTESVMGEGPAPNERNGQVLPPGLFAALVKVFPSDPTPWEKRDIAIMLLLMDTGMTSGELRELEKGHIKKNFTDPGQFWLEIDGPRGAQRRRISTRGPTGAALHRWKVYRDVMNRNTEVFFVSEKRGPMQRNTLFCLVARYVTAACQLAQVDLPNHIGPGTIRNTAIVRWINSGEPINQICERIGVKDIRNLLVRLAPHISAVAMATAREHYATMNMPVGAQSPNDPLEPAPS